MSKRISIFVSSMIYSLILTGCAIKDDDTTSEKFIKHTVNAPAYVIMGAGFVATEGTKAALTAVSLPPYMAYKYLTNDSNVSDSNLSDANTTNAAAIEE